jgi:hypothetical protein
MANAKTLILSMKFPLKTGIGTDRRIPFWPEELQGPKEKSNRQIAEL